MTDFEFVFVLYALLLGLSMVELLAGFGRAMEYKFARDAADQGFAVGWLTPLLAIFVLLDLISFWIFAWTIRTLIEVNSLTIMGVTGFAASYYLAARLVFPSEPDSFTDLDDHFYRVRRLVMGILMVLVIVQWTYLLAQVGFEPFLTNTLPLWLTAALIVLMALTMVWKNDRLNAAILIVLIARYVVIYAM